MLDDRSVPQIKLPGVTPVTLSLLGVKPNEVEIENNLQLSGQYGKRYLGR